MSKFARRNTNPTARALYSTLVLRHESTRDPREQESIRNRLRDERKNTMLAAVICHDHQDRSGAELHYSQFREASGALYTITEDRRYISGLAGDIRAHGRQGIPGKPTP